MANHIDKSKIKDESLRLEKEEPEKAIDYYNGLLTHEYFINDSWPYQRLVLMYQEETKKLKDENKTLKKEKEDLLNHIAELENKKPKKEKPEKKNYPNVSNFENKYVYEIPFNLDELNLTKYPIYEYDSTLNELDNLKRKNILIQYGKLLTLNKQTDDAIRYYKYLCNNTYFKNDWYPYRQLTILYDKTKDYNANLVNIKKLYHSNIYLNRYQFVWFSEKIRRILEKTDVNENEIKEWFEYYKSHGALNESKSNKFLADKFMKINDDVILVITDEYFDYRQERYALEETGRVHERVGNYELAVAHYKKIIDEKEFNFYTFYQRLCYCLEKLKDYPRELEAIKLYYTSPPIEISEYSDEWFKKRLEKVNKKLNTNWNFENKDKCAKAEASLIKKNGKFGEVGSSNPNCELIKDNLMIDDPFMKFTRLEIDDNNPKIKYISVKEYFSEMGRINNDYVKKSFEFAYSMTFGNEGQHRSYRSGGRYRRKNGEIFTNTFQGKLCEFAVYQMLNKTHDINEPDLEVYELGKWDSYDFKIDGLTTSIKSTKFFGQLLLLETKDWTLNAEYIPNNNEHYDITIMVRLEDEIEQIMKRNKLYYSQICDKTKLWEKFRNNKWAFDIPGYLTSNDLKYLINNKFIINRGDLLNGRTKMDAQNYYCHIADMHNILDLKNIKNKL